MIRRTFDASFLNVVVNHPEVRPWLAGEGPLDLTQAVLNPANYVLVTEGGGFVLMRHEPSRYEVHTQFLPGYGACEAMIEAQEWMFTRSDCEAIVSKVPRANKAAKGLAIKGGLRTIFERDDQALGSCEYVELTLTDCAMRTAGMEAHGERFHAFLESAKASELHPHDPAHERAVGAALLMIERGQPAKGVGFYNRWARLAGYAEIALVSDSPVTVDVVDAVIGLGSDGMEVQLCR